VDKIPVVESAKELMTDAVAWSVMKWLREKKTVRKMADEANAALDQMNQAVKDRWPEDVKNAYQALGSQARANGRKRPQANSASADPRAVLNVTKVWQADEEAQRARVDAEETFDIAEKQLSTALAREGCRKAIASWELHETAIRKAEQLVSQEQPQKN
jgi:hypothetical protein